MTSSGRRRWAAVLALPALAGALLVMHGLDVASAEVGVHGSATASAAHSDGHTGGDERGPARCDGCHVRHAVAACVAVLGTLVTLRLAGRVVRVRASSLGRPTCPGRRQRVLREVLRPPEPAWVRLAVMRC